MLKKTALALFGLVVAVTLIAPPKASAQIHVGVRIGSPEAYGVVVVQPVRYVEYDEPYYAAHYWNSGYHDGYYYDRGQRYRQDDRGYRHYDNRFRDERHDRDHRGRDDRDRGDHRDRGYRDRGDHRDHRDHGNGDHDYRDRR